MKAAAGTPPASLLVAPVGGAALLLLHRQPAEEKHQSGLLAPRGRLAHPTGIRAEAGKGAPRRHDERTADVWTARTPARGGRRDLTEKLAEEVAEVPEVPGPRTPAART